MTKPSKQKIDWEKEFDKRFKDGDDPFGYGLTSIISEYSKPQKVMLDGKRCFMQSYNEATVAEIKDFIRQTLSIQRQQLIKEIIKGLSFYDYKGNTKTVELIEYLKSL